MAPPNNPNEPPDLPFSQCTLTPRGVMSLANHLRQVPLLANVPISRLRAMAIAYLAHGGTNDGQHAVPANRLHRSHYAAHLNDHGLTWRTHLRDDFRQAITDLVRHSLNDSIRGVKLTIRHQNTWNDRLSGGTSFWMHSAGTRMPHTPANPEEAKMDVFLPYLLIDDPAVRIVIARMVQMFAENIAVPTMMRWDVAKGLNVGGRLYNANTPRQPSNRAPLPYIIPNNINTPYITMYGRAPGSLENLIAAFHSAVVPAAAAPLASATAVAPVPATTAPVPATIAPVPAVASSHAGPTTPPPAAHVALPPPPSTIPVTPTRAVPKSPGSAASTRVYLSPPGKPHIKVQFDSDDPWTETDATVWAESMEEEMSQSSTRLYPLSGRIALIEQLQSRISELEDIVTAQVTEITRLESIVGRDDSDDDSGMLASL